MSTQTARSILIAELRDLWSIGQINTRFEVIRYCVGRFETIDESIIDAVNALYCEKYITE